MFLKSDWIFCLRFFIFSWSQERMLNRWEQPSNYPWTNDRVGVWSRTPCGLTKEEALTCAMAWRDPGDVMLSRVSQKQGGDCCIMPPTPGAQSGHIRDAKQKPVYQGLGGGTACPCLMVTEFHLGVKTSPGGGWR